MVGSYVYKEFSRTGFAAGGELGGLTVEARQFGLEMQMAKIEVAGNPAAYISFMPPKSAMDGRFRRNHSFLCNPVFLRVETCSPQGNTGDHRGRGDHRARRTQSIKPQHVPDTDVH